jgi:AbrB family looped-hinge helix DNA binding protein
MDAAGRVVVPRAIRRELGLEGPLEVEITARDGRIVIEPATLHTKLVRRGKRLWVLEPQEPTPVLTSGETRETLEAVRNWPR